MDELTLDGKMYLSSKKSAEITGYAKDYVGQLCREGRVEARLVGRNWYVLESSIREHRFGAPVVSSTPEPIETAPQAEESSYAWTAPQYHAETARPIELRENVVPAPEPVELAPAPIEAPVVPPAVTHHAADSVITSPVLQEMQSAWHEWFQKEGQLKVAEETLLENSAPETTPDVESTPISINRLADPQIEEVEDERLENTEPVMLRRSLPSQPLYIPQEVREEVKTKDATLVEWEEHAQQRKVHENQLHTLRLSRRPSRILQFLFVLMAISAVLVSLVGSGKFENQVRRVGQKYPIVQYLAGERSLYK